MFVNVVPLAASVCEVWLTLETPVRLKVTYVDEQTGVSGEAVGVFVGAVLPIFGILDAYDLLPVKDRSIALQTTELGFRKNTCRKAGSVKELVHGSDPKRGSSVHGCKQLTTFEKDSLNLRLRLSVDLASGFTGRVFASKESVTLKLLRARVLVVVVVVRSSGLSWTTQPGDGSQLQAHPTPTEILISECNPLDSFFAPSVSPHPPGGAAALCTHSLERLRRRTWQMSSTTSTDTMSSATMMPAAMPIVAAETPSACPAPPATRTGRLEVPSEMSACYINFWDSKSLGFKGAETTRWECRGCKCLF